MLEISFLVFSLGLISYGCFNLLRFRRVIRQGNTTKAVVIEIYEMGREGGPTWVPALHYTVDGIEYTKKVRYSGEPNKSLGRQPDDSKHNYYLGKRLTIFYDAKKPSYFVADAEGSRRILYIIGLGAVLLATVLLARFIGLE